MASVIHHFALLPIVLIIFTSCPILTASQSYRNITLNSSIIANNNDNNTIWASPSGDFAFGFQQVVPGGYLLAIWFDKIPEKTIVWSANPDNLAREGSKIELFADGRFVLDDPNGSRIWGAGIAGTSVAYGAMLDTGNLVLVSSTSAILWQSFDWPTDTILPTQILSQGVDMISRFTATNYSSGRFRFIMQSDGNLVLYTRNLPLNDGISSYWSSDTVGSGYQLVFNRSGHISLLAQNGSVLSTISSNGASSAQFYQRLILEYDGVLRHYVYPNSINSSSGRPMAWSVIVSLPPNICLAIRQDTGGGACGFNSLCSMGTEQRPTCSCPIGYVRLDPNDPLSGCKPNFPQQFCGQEAQDSGLYSFNDMPNTDWPLSDYGHFQPVEEEWCRQACLLDCFCAVAIYRNNNCWKKRYPLSNGKIDVSVGGTALVKISSNSSATGNNGAGNKSNSSKNRSALVIAGSVLLGSSVLLILIMLSSVLFFGFGLKVKTSKTNQARGFVPGLNLRSFGYNELEEATDGFKTELGRGACSTVFRGTLKGENGKIVAVKRLDKLPKDAEREFRAEVSSISMTNHKNLVRLLGYCDEGENRLLVYEFMSNGSLANYLFENNNNRPDWYTRVKIAFATARGLLYLHEECSTQIIHCDIKPQNVLLDDALVPKISDFGLAKLLRPDQSRTTTGIRGTRGYVAPEWYRNMPITTKVDVYSFGILLLEILCCRRHAERGVRDENEAILADYAYDCYTEGALHLLVADDEEALGDMKRFEKLVLIAVWCIQEDPSLRPNMKRVMQMLEGSVEVPSPPDPSSFVN